MKNYPFRWFKNITALLEKREYNVFTIFFFSLFVGSFRRFLEWVLGGVHEPFPFNFIVTLTSFYWLSFFIFTLVLKFLIPQPWRISINVILVGIFLGIFPPILDTLISGTGFSYAYVWGLPETFHWYLYNPDLNIPMGEAIILWAAILFTTLYVAYKTRSWWRTPVALVAAYAAVLVIGGVFAGTAALIRDVSGWESTHQVILVDLLQVTAAFVIYLILQPLLFKGLLLRVVSILPLIALCLAGSALGGGIFPTTIAYAALLFLILLVIRAHHDFFEAVEAGREESSYVDREDVHFLTLTAGMLLAALMAANSMALLPLLLIFLLSLMYRFPLLHHKARFPHDVLLRGGWGVSALLVGIIAAIEHGAYGSPRWWIAFLPAPAEEVLVGAFDGTMLAILLAVFGASLWFVLLHDALPWNREAGKGGGVPVSTVSKAPARGHRVLVGGAAVLLLAGPLLLVLVDKLAWVHAAGGVIASALLWQLLAGSPSVNRYHTAILLLTGYLVHLSLGMQP